MIPDKQEVEIREKEVGTKYVGGSYTELSAQELQEAVDEWISEQKANGHPVEISSWKIYAEGNYNGGAELKVIMYRWETKQEATVREAIEKVNREEQQRRIEREEKNRLEKENDPDYQQLQLLMKKFKLK